MTYARQTGGPRPTTLRVLPSPPDHPTTRAEGAPNKFDPLLDELADEFARLENAQPGTPAADHRSPRVAPAAAGHGPRAEVPAPADPSVPTAPDGPSIPEPSVPQPDEPATPAVPDEPITPIDPVPQPETPDQQPEEVPNVGF